MSQKEFEACFLAKQSTLHDAMSVLESPAFGVALIVDTNRRLQGILTDGDVRRALLSGATMDDWASRYANRSFVSVSPSMDRLAVIELMQARSIRAIPVVERTGTVVGLHLLHSLLGKERLPNVAVVMAGGKGTRLRPVTESVPKPMIEVAGRPILERIVYHLVSHGISRIYLSVNYMSHVIEDHFDDGTNFGCEIKYLRETEPMGTAGCLSMLPNSITDDVVVMNGDLIVQANLQSLLAHHRNRRNYATMGVRTYAHQVPFGCVDTIDGVITDLREKPVLEKKVNAGLYVLSPSAIAQIPTKRFDMTELFQSAIQEQKQCGVFDIEGEWIDVGRHEDLSRARGT